MVSAVILISASPFTGAQAASENPLNLAAQSAVLIEQSTGQILYSYNQSQRMAPASVTKVMTLLLVAEALESGKISLEDKVAASPYACSMGGSQIYLEPGEEMTVDDLLKAVAVSSANDAAVVLAEHVAGSSEMFIEMMNARAKELGMKDTNFKNCNGLEEPEHYTTAYDIALMSAAVIRHDIVRKYSTIWMDTLRGGKFQLANTNKMIKTYQGITGLKTGFTSVAKYCLSATAERNGMGLVAVVLGCEKSDVRFDAARKLLDHGFATYELATPEITPEDLKPITVLGGKKDAVELKVLDTASVVVKKGEASKISWEKSFPKDLAAPVRAGQKIGEIVVSKDGETIKLISVTAAEDVLRLGYFGNLVKILGIVISG